VRETIQEICDAINGEAGDVNQKLAMIGAVLETIVVNEVRTEFRAQAVDKFCGIVRDRIGATLN
jgi:hypothetical protein